MGLERQSNAQNDQHKNPQGAGSNPVKFKKEIKYFYCTFFIHWFDFLLIDLIFILLVLHFC